MYIRKHSMVTESYKNLILGFVVVTVALVGLVVYFSAGRAVIKVTPRVTDIETDVVIDVVTDGGGEGNYLQGILFETEVENKIEGEATGTELLSGGVIGTVTLINKREEAQTLVKTTRLLSQDNILLRLAERVVIPANGQIAAKVYADDPNAFTELAPTTFKIPGLWEGLQDKVYAESKSVIKSTGASVKIVLDADMARTKEQLTEKLYQQAMEEFKQQLLDQKYVTLVVSKKVLQESVAVTAGAKQDKFEMTMKLDVVVLGLDQEKIIALAAERLQKAIPAGKEIAGLATDKFTYQLQNFNDDKKIANVKIHVSGKSLLKADNPLFDRDKIADLSPKGVELYLINFEEVEAVTVELSPFWVKKVPRLAERIEIVIVNPTNNQTDQ